MDKLYAEKKFAKALFIADTCQAFTLFDKVTTPNVMALGTSLIDESAYAHHSKFSCCIVKDLLETPILFCILYREE